MSLVKSSKADTLKVGGSTYVLIDNNGDEKKESTPVEKYPVVYCRKTRTSTILSAKLCDPRGFVVDNIATANFVMSGNVGSKKKAVKRIKKSGIPKVGTKTFGNEGIPKMSHHLNPLKNYLFCGFCPSTTLVSLTTGTYTNWTFTLSQLDNASAFTALYDEYCVRRIEMWFLPSTTEQTTINKTPYNLYTAYDMDGASVASIADIRQYESVCVTNVTEGQYISFTPSVAIATYGGAFTKYSYEMNQWLDLANTDITLYGAASVIDGAAVNNDWQFAVHARLWVEFRGVR